MLDLNINKELSKVKSIHYLIYMTCMPVSGQIKSIKRLNNYLSNTTQLAWALFASAATAPQGDPDKICILTLICKEGQDEIHGININGAEGSHIRKHQHTLFGS